jgi:hypothetical protein
LVKVFPISPQNELLVTQRLAAEIERRWPSGDGHRADRIDLLVGVRSGTDVDLLVALDLEQPRPFADTTDGWVQYALIAIEIKQLDPGRYTRIGNQLLPDYRDGGANKRSVGDQARDAALGVKGFARTSGFPDLYIYALAWLTEVEEGDLQGVDPIVVGRQRGWFDMLAAAARQHPMLPDDDAAVRSLRDGVRAVRDRLLNRRKLSALDRIKSVRIANDIAAREIVSAIAPRAGRAFIRLAGRGGSGKTTALALLAKRLATLEGGRVLVLTFHHALRGDIEHVLATMPDAQVLLNDRIRVETVTGFLLALLEVLTGAVPSDESGKVNYDRLDEAYRAAAISLKDGPDGELAMSLRQVDGGRFDWDHILIDEAQDWTDDERDLLRAVYGHRRIAIADGMEQLVRRQTPCDWLRGLPRGEIVQRVLGDSLRMQRNIALFVNAFARAAGFMDWTVNPREDMPGGRIIIAVGDEGQTGDLVRAMEAAAIRDRADPVDCLVCVPHTNIVRDADGGRHAGFADCVAAAGGASWDAVDLTTRTVAPASTAAWRIVQYDSCRGLEGWITAVLDLDQLYAHKLRYPNYHRDDRTGDDEAVARRWLLIPLTRAVHMLVITVRDADSPVTAMLREASAAMPVGIVEWCSAAECANRVSPHTGMNSQ